jgi:hypothetical protein
MEIYVHDIRSALVIGLIAASSGHLSTPLARLFLCLDRPLSLDQATIVARLRTHLCQRWTALLEVGHSNCRMRLGERNQAVVPYGAPWPPVPAFNLVARRLACLIPERRRQRPPTSNLKFQQGV